MGVRLLSSPWFLFLLLFAMCAGNVFAISGGWYWRVSWFDNILHFSGGVWAAGILLWILRTRFPREFEAFEKRPLPIVLFLISFGVLAGTLWEFFEFSFDVLLSFRFHLPRAQIDITDTMGDLFFDLLGASVTAVVYLKSRRLPK